MIADDLLNIARRLAAGGNPTQTDLRRAISSVYYAVFHAICQSNADTLVGEDPQLRDQVAWRQAYRALNTVTPGNVANRPEAMAGSLRQFASWPTALYYFKVAATGLTMTQMKVLHRRKL